jgi:SAM-dependent methyltransferase
MRAVDASVQSEHDSHVSGDQPQPVVTQGELWSARARDWAELQEPQHRPKYDDAVQRISVGPGVALLDLGCGAGTFCRMAASAGASVTGIDSAPAMIEIARELVPEGRFDVGDIRRLPYPDAGFDRVTAFNSLQFLPDPAVALTEVFRVSTSGALVYVLVWGRPEHTDLVAMMHALHPLLPPRPAGSGGPFALTPPGILEQLLADGGFTVTDAGYLTMPYEYLDEATMLRAQCSSGPAVLAARTAGEEKVRDALTAAIAQFRTRTGYRIDTEYRFVTASKTA